MTLTKIEYRGYHCADGGNIHVVDGISPGPIRRGNYGVGFGPLRLTPWANSTTVIDGLEFAHADSSWFPLSAAGATAVAAHYDEETVDPEEAPVSRRGVLAAIGTLALAGTAAAATEDRYNVARFDLHSNPRGLKIDVDDVVADYLPPEHTFYVSAGGTNVGRFDAGSETLTINPGITGTVEIESDDALSFIDEFIAKVTTEDELRYEFQPEVFGEEGGPETFADFTVGETVTISTQPVLVDPIDAADPADTIVKLDGTTIPHVAGDDSAAGSWRLRDGRALIYEVGEGAPDTSMAEIRVNIGRFDRFKARYI